MLRQKSCVSYMINLKRYLQTCRKTEGGAQNLATALSKRAVNLNHFTSFGRQAFSELQAELCIPFPQAVTDVVQMVRVNA